MARRRKRCHEFAKHGQCRLEHGHWGAHVFPRGNPSMVSLLTGKRQRKTGWHDPRLWRGVPLGDPAAVVRRAEQIRRSRSNPPGDWRGRQALFRSLQATGGPLDRRGREKYLTSYWGKPKRKRKRKTNPATTAIMRKAMKAAWRTIKARRRR